MSDVRQRVPVRIQNWVEGHRRNAQANNQSMGLLDTLVQLSREEVIAFNGLPPEGSGGGPFVNYDQPFISAEALMSFDSITGVCTSGVHAVYQITGALQIVDAQKDEDYGIQLVKTGVSPSISINDVRFWNNKSNAIVIQYSFPVELAVGDTIHQELLISGAGSVNAGGYAGSFLQVDMNHLLTP